MDKVKLQTDRQTDRQTDTRLTGLQGLRAVAFIAIFISHANLGSFGAFGAWGVSIFFALSGFLLTYVKLIKNETPHFGFKFMWSKIRRLYPLHITMMLCCVLIRIYSLMKGTGNIVQLIIDVVLHSSLTQIWIPYSKYYVTLNGPSWYLGAIAFLYLMFPVIFKFIKKIKSKKQCIVILTSLFLLQICLAIIAYNFGADDKNSVFSCQWILYYCPLSRLLDYTIGACTGWLFIKYKNRPINKYHFCGEILVLTAIVLSLCVYITGKTFLSQEAIKYTLLFIPTSTLLIYLTARGGFVSRVLSCKGLVFIGDYSPYTFLIHGVVIKYIGLLSSKIFEFKVNGILLAMVSFIVTMFSAWLWTQLVKSITKE